jgi:hypothetical protein
MKKFPVFSTIISLFLAFSVQSQNMSNGELEKIIYVVSDTLQGITGNWQFIIDDKLFICVTDEKHNRMRIISPIIEEEKLSNAEKQKLLEANFHTALDARYAIANNYLWAVFIHPLRELSKNQVVDAINQVYTAVLTYGTTYNSTDLSFPGSNSEIENGSEIKSKPKKEKKT